MPGVQDLAGWAPEPVLVAAAARPGMVARAGRSVVPAAAPGTARIPARVPAAVPARDRVRAGPRRRPAPAAAVEPRLHDRRDRGGGAARRRHRRRGVADLPGGQRGRRTSRPPAERPVPVRDPGVRRRRLAGGARRQRGGGDRGRLQLQVRRPRAGYRRPDHRRACADRRRGVQVRRERRGERGRDGRTGARADRAPRRSAASGAAARSPSTVAGSSRSRCSRRRIRSGTSRSPRWVCCR